MTEFEIFDLENVSPLPWRMEERLGHSSDMKYRYVIVDANGDRVAIISLRGSPKGDRVISRNNAFRLIRGANFIAPWKNKND